MRCARNDTNACKLANKREIAAQARNDRWKLATPRGGFDKLSSRGQDGHRTIAADQPAMRQPYHLADLLCQLA